ncbi:MAG: YraN family protein [Patescibacteria group bacterium]
MSFTQKQEIGNLGEDLACEFLMKHGYKILDRNYRKKWGEIDIIAIKNNIIHFVEVKSVSHVTDYLPEENIHPWKRKRLARAIQTYLLENPAVSGTDETEWQTDSLAVFLDFQTRKARFRLLENIIL